MHPSEALHGDLGRLVRHDVLVALSYSGETAELLQLLDTVKRLAIPLISLTGNLNSTLAQASDAVLDVGIRQEACPLGLAPTASTTAMLAMGDALAMALLEKRGFDEADYAALHPGGDLGVKLRRVESVMHTGDQIPRVGPHTPMPDVIYEMSKKGLGHADGDRRVEPPAGNRLRWRPAPIDPAGRESRLGPEGGRRHDSKSRDHRQAGVGHQSPQSHGGPENHLPAGCGR